MPSLRTFSLKICSELPLLFHACKVRSLIFERCTTPIISPKYPRFITATSLRRTANTLHPPEAGDAIHAHGATSHLPLTCPGCGAFSHTNEPGLAGYYSPNRKGLRPKSAENSYSARLKEAEVVNQALALASQTAGRQETLAQVAKPEPLDAALPHTAVCDRCHDLVYHNHGNSIIHPTLDSIADMIMDSPHRYNHIYHVIDAADFPMSIIPNLQQVLDLGRLRGSNRRAHHIFHRRGRILEMSFLITRSDLLAPTKPQVDSLMPYLTEQIRSALNLSAQSVRLGNVRCVSAKRGWWTSRVKEDIYSHGGGAWLVGRVNVGKSNLYEAVFPKGRGLPKQGADHRSSSLHSLKPEQIVTKDETFGGQIDDGSANFATDSLLPPIPQETAFPQMPIISHLPGTTASPIRHLYGNGRGEVIDLPGLARGDIDLCVLEQYRSDLVLQKRVAAPQHVLKPGQSFLLDDLIRISVSGPYDEVLLICPFVNLRSHITGTDKAIAVQAHQASSGVVRKITTDEAAANIQSAGKFALEWDVTRQRSGALTASDAAGIKPESLSFVIFSADLLIEGVGWVELAMQVRKRSMQDLEDGVSPFPMVEVFSPFGKHISFRKPLNGWVLGGKKRAAAHQRTQRPRRSMKGAKKEQKARMRALTRSVD